MRVVLLNPPLVGRRITRDMAGGLGIDAGKQVLLPPIDLTLLAATLRQKNVRF